MNFFKDNDAKKYGNIPLISVQNDEIFLSKELNDLYKNKEFQKYLDDALDYGIQCFLSDYNPEKYYHGFKLYGSYTRKDACRILNWKKDESSTIYGYRIKYNTCPIFVTYQKSNDISDSTKYEDCFIDNKHFHWMTRSKVNIESKEVYDIRNPQVLKLLFIKKNDDEGSEFYFIGPVSHKNSIGSSIESKGQKLSIVEIFYTLDVPAAPKIYKYFEG